MRSDPHRPALASRRAAPERARLLRRTAAVALQAGALALVPLPAAAQPAPPPAPATSDTTAPSPTGSSSSSSSTTTSTTTVPAPGPTGAPGVPGAVPGPPPGEAVPPGLPAPVGDVAAGGDAPPPPVPNLDVTVPPRPPARTGAYADQVPLSQHPGRLVRVTAGATVRAAETRAALDAAVARRDLLLVRQAELQRVTERLEVEERTAIADVERAQLELERRAAEAYVRGGTDLGRTLILSDDAGQFVQRKELLEVVVEQDSETVRRYRQARAKVDRQQARTAEDLVRVAGELKVAEEDIWEAQLAHDRASRELEVFLAGGRFVIHGFVFPVADPHTFGGSFGAPRMSGTAFEHWHEGADIFAPMGTPLFACERGVVTGIGTGGLLGGNSLWLVGESGTAYYYAHLSGFAPGVREGLVVEAGTVLGYVGDTGNARGTPPHLHFEVHPDRGQAVDPAPILTVADRQPQPPPIHVVPPPGG